MRITARRTAITRVEVESPRNESYQHPVWGHGKWKGELAIAGESWKTADLDENALENQHIQQVMRARSGGDVGIGVLEQICIGPYPKYGLKGFLDPAP